MRITKKAVRKAAEKRKKAEAAKVQRTGRVDTSPFSVQIVTEPIPPVLFKYTTDAGVAGMREGIVRLGSCQSYRESEDEKIRDPYENAVITSPGLGFYDPRTGKAGVGRLAVAFPGTIFCASADPSLRGAFFDHNDREPYNRRIAIRTMPFVDALGDATTQSHHIFDFDKSGGRKIVKPRFFDNGGRMSASLESWSRVHPKILSRVLGVGQVRYVANPNSKANPWALFHAGRMGGEQGGRLMVELLRDDDYPAMRKHRRFEHEKEWRVVLYFSPKADDSKFTKDGGAIRCYHTDSLFVKIDNPRDVFIFDD